MKEFLYHIARTFRDQIANASIPCVIANMHALPTVAVLLDTLLENGVAPHDVLFIGKPYSTIAAAKTEITQAGIPFSEATSRFFAGDLVPLHVAHLRQVLIPWVRQRSKRHFVLLDSGGHVTREFDAPFPHIERTSIQLTSSGSRLPSPAGKTRIDLGTFDAKKDHESQAIATAICAATEAPVRTLEGKRICVIGNGAIGRSISKVLTARHILHDTSNGTDPALPARHYDLVFGATGYDVSDLVAPIRSATGRVDLVSCFIMGYGISRSPSFRPAPCQSRWTGRRGRCRSAGVRRAQRRLPHQFQSLPRIGTGARDRHDAGRNAAPAP